MLLQSSLSEQRYDRIVKYCAWYTFTSLADINECGSNPCENEGTCTDVPNGYTCVCESGYTGDECQTGIYNYNM